jgi:hypothetical protein
MNLFANFLLFQLAWFACVLGAANGHPWVGPAVVAGLVVLHLRFVPEPRAESMLLVAAAVIGTAFDSLLVSTGWLAYPSGQWVEYMAPYWIIAMWVGFATTLNVSLNWLKHRPAMAAGFGAIGGPLAYLAGEKLGGVIFTSSAAALVALAIGWGLIMPLLMALAARLDGWRPGVGRRVLATVQGGSRHV